MRYIKAIYIGLIGMLLAGCQADQWESIEGGFQITLRDEITVTTKSTPAELGEPTTDKFKLKIVNEATNNAAYDGAYKSGTIPAAAGTYTVTATFGDNPVLALDDPYYKGDTTGVKVEEGQTTSITLNCKVANALATIFYADTAKFDEMYSSYGVEVKVNNSSVTIGNGSKKSAYYQAGSKPTFTFKGILKGNNKEVCKVLANDLLSSASTFEARKHCKLTLSMKATASGLVPTINKAEATTVTINETIPMEWLPAPKVSSTGFDENKTLTIYETVAPNAASIDFEVAQPLQDLSFTLNFEDEQFTSLNKDYQLSTMTDEEKIALSDVGITLPLIGSNEPKITFSQAFNASLLSKNDDDGVVENMITINSVQANNRENKDEAPLTYTIAVHKPEFTVSAYPGNIWTKEFTMNTLMEEQVTKGNFSKLSTDMKYQFSINGESDWTDLGEDLRKDGLTPGTTYYIRGVYRGEICSDPVAVSTYPIIELENGDMEDWDYEITDNNRNELVKNRDYIYWKKWFPWKSVGESTYWNTVNQTTTQDGNSPDVQWYPFVGTVSNPPYVGCCYVANSGTIPVEGGDAHSGKSALLKTVGWGSGSTAGGDASDIKHVTPAELYLGTYDLPNHQPIYGIDYNSRPTAMKFWCKYIPKSTDLLIAQINILDSEGTIIGRANIASEEAGATDWTERILPIEYTDLSKTPKKMYIVFKSGSLTNTDIMDKPAFGNLSDAESVGSKLYIDDISLVYDK